MSAISETCDYLIGDLQSNITALAGTITHRYAPWDPARFIAEKGERHLAVWPSPDLENAQPFTTQSHELIQSFLIAYWENAGDEDMQQVANEDAASRMLDLHQAMRARFYELANQIIAQSWLVWYQGAAINDATSHTRWLVLSVEVHRSQEFI